jgi:hypothetical protein
MANLVKELESLLKLEALRSLLDSNAIKINQLCTAIALPIKAGIPFDLSYSPGTRREEASAQLAIYINPNTTIQFTLSFEAGGSTFGGSPPP